jgi:glycosyltransferase involved in cell wall biosynthesis
MAERRKVLWLIKCLGAGGAEKLLAMSLPYLNREQFNYQVAYFVKSNNYLVPEFERAGIPVICLDVDKPYDVRSVFRLARILRERQIDILHIHSPYWGAVARLVGRLVGVKTILSTEHHQLIGLHPIVKLVSVLTYPINDATIGVSQAVVSSLRRWRTVRKKRLYAIHNGIDLKAIHITCSDPALIKERLGIDKRNFLVLNVANIKPQKGHQYLLMTVPLLLKQCPNTTFVLVGTAENQEFLRQLENLADRLGVRENVIFAGFRPDVVDLISACDVFILPSLWEPFGIVLLEAMAVGKPVIGTRVGGIPEVIEDGVSGYLVEPGSPQQLAQKLLQLLWDESLRSQLGQKGMQRVRERFNIQEMVKKVEQVYLSIGNHLDKS